MRKWSLKDLHRILRVALLNACNTFSPHFFEWWVGVTQIIMSTAYCAILKCLLYVFCICCPNTKFPDQKEKKLQKWPHVQSADRMILESTRTAYSHIYWLYGLCKKLRYFRTDKYGIWQAFWLHHRHHLPNALME